MRSPASAWPRPAQPRKQDSRSTTQRRAPSSGLRRESGAPCLQGQRQNTSNRSRGCAAAVHRPRRDRARVPARERLQRFPADIALPDLRDSFTLKARDPGAGVLPAWARQAWGGGRVVRAAVHGVRADDLASIPEHALLRVCDQLEAGAARLRRPRVLVGPDSSTSRSGVARGRVAGTSRCGEGGAHLDRPDRPGSARMQSHSKQDREEARNEKDRSARSERQAA